MAKAYDNRILERLLPFDLIYYNGPWWDLPCWWRRWRNNSEFGGVAILGYCSIVYTFGLFMSKQRFGQFLTNKQFKIVRCGRINRNMAEYTTHIIESHIGAFIPCWRWAARKMKKLGFRLWPIAGKRNIPYHLCPLAMVEWVYLQLLQSQGFRQLQTVIDVTDNR